MEAQAPAAQPTAEVLDEIVEEFELFDDWTERYKYIIDLGRKLPGIPEEYRTEEYKVRGCQSQVWLHADLTGGVVRYQAESDAAIVRGLIALTLRLYSGRTPDEILATAPEFIDRIGMNEHLSMTRSNGLQAVVKRIKMYAQAFKAIESR